MKKIISLILLMCMVLSFAAYAEESAAPEITMQEINDANQTEALLKNHRSVYLREEMDGEFWGEIYLTKDYCYNYFPDEESDWVEFITDDACYYNLYGDYVYYVSITPDGVSDFASARAERSASVALTADTEEDTIESVSEKDGRITVKTFVRQDAIEAEMEEFGVTSARAEYVLDAETLEIISHISDFTYEDGTAYRVVTEVTYDADAPEKAKTISGYDSQTENLRNLTVISNPGTEKEESKSIQVAKGLIIGFQYDDELGYAVEFYTDAACTEAYEPFADTDSDLTIYVKWIE